METIEDIIGDIRAQNQGLPEDGYALSPLVCDLLRLADRIDAAHKREVGVAENATTTKENLGVANGAKIREALMKVSELIHDEAKWADEMSNHQAIALGIIQSALAEPARNCDRFECFRDAVRAFGEMGYAYEEMAEWLFCETEGGAE